MATLSAPPATDMALTTEECSVCHDSTTAIRRRALTATPSGTSTAPPWQTSTRPADVTGCESCHDASLTIEHKDRTPDAGGAFDCETCHASTDPLVTAAIAAGTSACVACHPGAGHLDAHISTTADNALAGTTEVCGECHDADVQVEHAKATSTSAAAGCVACHPAPRDTLSPWDKDTCVQGGCHVAGSASAMHGLEASKHVLVSGQNSCVSVGCHDLNATTVFQNESIADIHATAAMPSATCKVDAGFEEGTEGTNLGAAWTVSGAPQHREYDAARAKTGALSGWITGPSTAAYAGVAESASAGMSSDGAELRFWLYQDTTNQFRRVYDATATGVGRAFFLFFPTNGAIQVQTVQDLASAGYVTGYNTVGTQASGLERVPHRLRLLCRHLHPLAACGAPQIPGPA